MAKGKEIILDTNIVRMLNEMEKAFKEFGIEYYLAGAFARDLQFQSRKSNSNFRRTNDIDLAICINDEYQYNELIDVLVETGSFKRNEKEPIKLHYHLGGLEVDLIPFGKIESKNRDVELTRPIPFVLQMPGFAELHNFVEEIKLDGITLNTCPLEGIVLLKLISNDDRPERTKDIADIEHIINAYFDWSIEEIYDKHHDILGVYETNTTYEKSVSAYLIGRKIKLLLTNSSELTFRISTILGKKNDYRWEAMHRGLNE